MAVKIYIYTKEYICIDIPTWHIFVIGVPVFINDVCSTWSTVTDDLDRLMLVRFRKGWSYGVPYHNILTFLFVASYWQTFRRENDMEKYITFLINDNIKQLEEYLLWRKLKALQKRSEY